MSSPIAPVAAHGAPALGVALSLAAAAVMVAGVLGFGWSVFTLMVLYWLENVIIGVANVVRILIAGARGGAGPFAASAFMAAFFSVHYGLFTFVHGIFVFSMFGPRAQPGEMADPNHAFDGFVAVVAGDRWLLLAIAMVALTVLADLLGWIAATRRNAPADKAAGKETISALMAAPYGRVVVLHLTLIFGAMLMSMFDAPAAAALLLVALKLGFDLMRLKAPGSKRGTR